MMDTVTECSGHNTTDRHNILKKHIKHKRETEGIGVSLFALLE